ncbi:hypothetical protein GCM10011503_14280 [Henriciella pelagia]|uniref:Rod shape-determining protein MreD n=1 Tax=Henriciella pelagia TaxID=1977912 RepID=A0ABQ1JI77_9PROT|nr:hypothetical protein GCM10011503_14280 [Henriciella pelagia]
MSGISRLWREAGPTSRLIIGFLMVALVGIVGLTPKSLFDQELVWPYAALVAAVGWGRSGVAFRPMVLLVILGVAQDVSAYAPLGCFGFINLSVFGLSAAFSRAFDRERAPIISMAAPVVLYAIAFSLVWLLASFASGHVVQVSPLISAMVVTYVMHMLMAPVFDLGRRIVPLTGSMV